MLICIINPNTTKKMTYRIEKVANKVASNGTSIVATNPKNGPESIEGYYDEVFCIPGIMEEVYSNKEADAYIIACFDDTGLEAVRTITDKPVLGIGESSFHIASCLAGTFSVITTLEVSVPILKSNLLKRGFDRICVNVNSVDVPVFKYKWKNSFLGVGLDFYNDRAGDLNLGTTQTDITVSNVLSLSNEITMSVGIQTTFNQYNMDYGNAMTGSQFIGAGYDPNLPTGEPGFFEPFSFFDVSTGATWNYASGESNIAANDMFIINLGVAFFHLNRPNLNFSAPDRLFPKIVAHGNMNIGIRYFKISLMPSYLFMMQGPLKELSVGSLIRLNLREESRHTGTISEASLLFGTHYRWNDAIIPSFGVDLGDYMLLLSYDLNISKLAVATQAKGGFEITLRYRNPELFVKGASASLQPKFM